VAQQGEAGASVHLPFDHLGLGVDALGAPVVVREGEPGERFLLAGGEAVRPGEQDPGGPAR
jgi:hypothetical protein